MIKYCILISMEYKVAYLEKPVVVEDVYALSKMRLYFGAAEYVFNVGIIYRGCTFADR